MNTSITTNESAPESNTGDEPVTRRLNLADPADRPDADVVVFDGNCHFCQKQVQRLNRFDAGNRLSFLSLHDTRVAKLCPNLTHEQLMDQMYIATVDGDLHGGAAAVRYLSRRLPRLWWLAPLMHIPFSMPLWRWAYKQVAIRRYRWNQKADPAAAECEDACEIHLGKKKPG